MKTDAHIHRAVPAGQLCYEPAGRKAGGGTAGGEGTAAEAVRPFGGGVESGGFSIVPHAVGTLGAGFVSRTDDPIDRPQGEIPLDPFDPSVRLCLAGRRLASLADRAGTAHPKRRGAYFHRTRALGAVRHGRRLGADSLGAPLYPPGVRRSAGGGGSFEAGGENHGAAGFFR